jgi:arylsulfatase A-like enzyme
MQRTEKHLTILATLIIYTSLFIMAEIVFFYLFYKINGLVNITNSAISPNIFYSRVVLLPTLYFLLAEMILYVIYIYVLWYVTSKVSQFFSLTLSSQHYLALTIWAISVIAILSLNMYYVPHSIFTFMIRHDLLNDMLTDTQLLFILSLAILILLLCAVIAFVQAGKDIIHKKNPVHHAIILAIFLMLLFSYDLFPLSEKHKSVQAATAKKPNIILIGLDAVRPDYLSYFNQKQQATPHINAFLNSSTVFVNAYTPLARTLPSWGGILTGKYPIHSLIRENNVYVSTHDLLETLPKKFKEAGYETLYATDDRRFNNIDKRYGFDQLVGPQGTIADFFIGTLCDFPLSNLVVGSRLGKILFPYSYANHGAYHTYHFNHFLGEINDAIQETGHSPLFLAVHFNLSAWPFIWFNDKQAYNVSLFRSYGQSVLADDQLFAKFLALLKANHLLDHAILVLLSDHGISLALPGDREISAEKFQGEKAEMKVRKTKYSNQQDHLFDLRETLTELMKDTAEIKQQLYDNHSTYLDLKNYGIDTSFGYGGDVLTFKQNRTLLAMKAYGVDAAMPPHQVKGTVLLLDIAPTLLDLLHLPRLPHADGISLKPALLSSAAEVNERAIFIESGFSFNAIEQEDIILSKVLASSISYFMLSSKTGLVMLNPSYLGILIESKERAILQNGWMLARFPASERFRFVRKQDAQQTEGLKVESHLLPSYFVLLNLKTGEWVTDGNQALLLHSPYIALDQSLNQFYGNEMKAYHT